MIQELDYSSSFGVEDLFALPEQPVSEQIFNYTSESISIPIQTSAFTIVLSRDVRRNTYMGAELAFNAAREDLTKDVWYVNTFAGVNFLKQCFQQVFEKSGLGIPTPSEREEEEDLGAEPVPDHVQFPEPAYDSPKPHPRIFRLPPWEPEPPDDTEKFLHDGTRYVFGDGQYWRVESEEVWKQEDAALRQEENLRRKAEAQQAALPLQGKELDPSQVLPNLRVFHVPVGHWDTELLADDIRSNGRMGCRQLIVINSFEYAPLTRGRKERMAVELIQLSERLDLSIVVFSHEMKKDVEAGLPGRGPIGILAAKAATVSRFHDRFEKFYGTKSAP